MHLIDEQDRGENYHFICNFVYIRPKNIFVKAIFCFCFFGIRILEAN